MPRYQTITYVDDSLGPIEETIDRDLEDELVRLRREVQRREWETLRDTIGLGIMLIHHNIDTAREELYVAFAQADMQVRLHE